MGKIKTKIKSKPNSRRGKISKEIQDIKTWHSSSLVAVSRKKIRTWKAAFFIFFIAGIIAASILSIFFNIQMRSKAEEDDVLGKIKNKGCVADGLLSGYGGDTDSLIEMINRSECRYLHRSVETWAAPPDFGIIEKNIRKIKNSDVILGMFLAEAINPEKNYKDLKTGREFDFSKMCQPKSKGTWGKNTCKADMNNKEYREYLTSIAKKAIDLGIGSFLFGQVHMQEDANLSDSKIFEVINEMKRYGKEKNKKIIIGAQTNTIQNEKYLKNFDYIEGGVGESPTGHVDEGPCNDYYKEKRGGWCWAMLWHDIFKSKANNVVLHLDWSGAEDDDMSVFSKMDQEDRIKNLNRYYKMFTSKNVGFLMPFLAVINPKNPVCYGPTREFYAPDNKYSCKDEDYINSIFRGTFIGNDSQFVSQEVPEKMVAGKKYQATVLIRNNGRFRWSLDKKYRLGSQNEQDNKIWGSNRVEMNPGSGVLPGQTATFIFEVAAPEKPGTYNFQWQMVNDGIEWFGEKTPPVAIVVASS